MKIVICYWTGAVEFGLDPKPWKKFDRAHQRVVGFGILILGLGFMLGFDPDEVTR